MINERIFIVILVMVGVILILFGACLREQERYNRPIEFYEKRSFSKERCENTYRGKHAMSVIHEYCSQHWRKYIEDDE